MTYNKTISSGTLRRIGRGLFIVILGPCIVPWDGGPDPKDLERELQDAVGDTGKHLSDLDLTDSFADLHGRDKLADLFQKKQPETPGRIHELIVALRPPWIFTCEHTGMIARAGEISNLAVNICFPEKDPIKAGDASHLTIVPLKGLGSMPGSLILTDADMVVYRKREHRVLAFLKDHVASHEIFFAGFRPGDKFLSKILQELGRDMIQYNRRALIFCDSPSRLERNLLERRGGKILSVNRDETLALLEALPGIVQQEMDSGLPGEDFHVEDLVVRLRSKIHEDMRKMLTTGISQPEHLETGEPPDLDEIYVVPFLSTWEPVSREIDIEEVARLAQERQDSKGVLSREISDFLDGGRISGRFHEQGALSEDMKNALKNIGYDLGSWERPFKESDPVKVIRETRQMVIIGDPASGKSQLLRYLAHKISDPEDKSGLGMKDVIPVFVPVRDYYLQRETGASLSSFLGKRVAEMIGEEEDAVVGLLKRNRVMLLLDGLDEVKSDDARKLVAEEIEEMIRTSGEIPCIVSSRPAGYRTARLTRNLPHLELDGFDDKRINELLFNWYKRIIGMEYRDLTEKEIKQRAQEARDDLFGRFNSFEGLLDLVRNPLMLTIAIFIHHIGLELPERRADFYLRAAQLLSRTWLRKKFRDRIELPREETLMDALERIAFKLHTEGSDNLISGDNLSELLLKLFMEREAYANVKAEREAENLRELMRSLIGIMVERGVDRFGFTHLSFQEYFTARYLALGGGRHMAVECMSRNLFKSGWDQVIRMYLQIAPRDEVNKVFEVLKGVEHPFDELFHTTIRRLAELLNEPNQVDSGHRKDILNKLLELAMDKNLDFMLHDLITKIAFVSRQDDYHIFHIFVNWLHDEEPKVRLASLEGLIRIGTKEPGIVETLIQMVRREKYPYIIEEVIKELRRMDVEEPELVEALSPLLKESEDVMHFGESIKILARLGISGPELIEILLQRIKQDEDEYIRGGAMEGLVRLGANGSEIIELFLHSIKQDKHDIVRSIAVNGLVKIGADGPEVIETLLQRIKEDEHEDVRKSAVEALIQTGANGPEIVETLLERIEQDEHEIVRRVAVDGLIKIDAARPELIETVLQWIRDNDFELPTPMESLVWLSSREPEVVEKLLRWIKKDKSGSVLWIAVISLVESGASVSMVIEALLQRIKQDEDKDIREAAVNGLIYIGASGSEVVATFLQRIKEDEDENIRKMAVYGLVQLGASESNVVEALLQRVNEDEDKDVRKAAVEGLGWIGANDAEVIETLLHLIKENEDESVRNEAVECLVQLGTSGSEVIETLLQRMKEDENSSVCMTAIKGLVQLGQNGPEICEALFNQIKKDEKRTSDFMNILSEALSKSNIYLIKKGIMEFGPGLMPDAFYYFGQSYLDLDFQPEEIIPANENKSIVQPNLQRIHKLSKLKTPPSGTNTLKSDLDFLTTQYPIIPTREKQIIRTLTAKWFIAKANETAKTKPAKRDALTADLETLTEFLNKVCRLTRDEDYRYKADLFRTIMPATEKLYKAKILGLRSIARYLFEALVRLYIYIPKADKDMLENKINQWRKPRSIPQDHPLHTDPSIERILNIASQRKNWT